MGRALPGVIMRRRSLLHLLFAVALPLLGASCLSPTLPLPPPEPESITADADGYFTVAGSCHEGAIVLVFNETQGVGALVEDRPPSGRFITKVKANPCDVGWASQIVGNETSLQSPVVFQPKSQNDKSVSSACR